MLARWISIGLVAGAVAMVAPPEPEVAGNALTAEIARLERVLAESERAALPEDVKGGAGALREALTRAKSAQTPDYQLYRLRDAWVGIETLAFLARNAAAGESVAAFEKLWNAHRAGRTAKPLKSEGSLLQRALIDSAMTRAERLDRASLPYSKASAPWSGVYYLGEAEANRRFAAFVRGLAQSERGNVEKSPSRERVAAALDAIERETLAIFGADISNQKLIAVSVRIKEARELLAAGRIDGAVLLATEARVALLRRGGARGTHAAPRVTAPPSLEALLLSWAGDEEAPMGETLRADVVPWYRSLYAQAPAAAKIAAQVKVTLVRWPYT
jgi:hypothetical protein